MNLKRAGDYIYEEDEDHENCLGKGTFGTVYLGWHYQNKKEKVAIKRISLKSSANKLQPLDIRKREAEILKDLKITPHRNLISLIDDDPKPNIVYLIMEFCNGGNLREYLEVNGTLSECAIRPFFLQIGSGLKFLHDRNIFHRDLKPENILLHYNEPDSRTPENAVLKIADFGLGKYRSSVDIEQTDCGTGKYRAPEIPSGYYDLKVDLWSIGVMIYECLGGISNLRPLQKLEYPKNASKDIRNLLAVLLVEEPQNRINSDQFLNHSFFREHKNWMERLQSITTFSLKMTKQPRGSKYLDERDGYPRIPRGLSNLGYTCYFNSAMQALCQTHVLYSELVQIKQILNSTLLNSFKELYREIHNGEMGSFPPEKLREQFIRRVPRFDNHRQHDSHECLRHFLDEIRKEERKANVSSEEKDLLTTVDKVFGGHLITVYNCLECGKHYHLFEPSLDLSLPVFLATEEYNTVIDMSCQAGSSVQRNTCTQWISATDENETKWQKSYRDKRIKPTISENVDENEDYKQSIHRLMTRLSSTSSRRFSNRNSINLYDCLDHFSRTECINREYLCTDCLNEAIKKGKTSEENLKLTSATKQTIIFNPPAVLTIHFKRFELLKGGAKKRSDKVEYPEFLDIGPYCSAECLRNDPPRNNIWYSLYAVIVHSGSLEFGHYMAYIKDRGKEENIRTLNRFLQRKFFNFYSTNEDVINMMANKMSQRRTGAWPPVRDGSKWYLLNDCSVREVSIEKVLKQEAYLLFYERIEDRGVPNAAEFSRKNKVSPVMENSIVNRSD